MTSISTSSSDGSLSPLSRVQTAIRRDASTGAISATDQTALTSALGDIASQLSTTGGGSGGSTIAASATSAPTSMKDRVGSLIDNEVSSGKLTSDQASELKKAFAQADGHIHGGHGHHGGENMLAAITGSSASEGTSPVGTLASGATSTNPPGTAATSAAGALEAFITQFTSALGASGLYGSTGAGSNGVTSLLVDSIG